PRGARPGGGYGPRGGAGAGAGASGGVRRQEGDEEGARRRGAHLRQVGTQYAELLVGPHAAERAQVARVIEYDRRLSFRLMERDLAIVKHGEDASLCLRKLEPRLPHVVLKEEVAVAGERPIDL